MIRRTCAALLAAVGLEAAAADRAAAVTPARNSAVGYALTLEHVTRDFTGRCGEVDRSRARLAHAAWNERNGELVESARRYLDFVARLLRQTQGEAAARRFEEEQKGAFARRAQLTVLDSLLGGGKREVCGRVLEAMASGRMDFAATPDHFRTLREIGVEMSRAR